MNKNLPATLRMAADFLDDVTNKQHAGFVHFPLWYTEAMREAADELEQLQADLRSSMDHCELCAHAAEPRLCDSSDYFCHECFQKDCICRDCRNGSKWEYRGADNG